MIKLYAPNGTLLKSSSNTWYVSDITQALSDTGTYTLLVGDNGGENTGIYDLYPERTRDPVNPVPISYGAYLNGTIAHSVQFNTYTFSGTSGDPV